MKLCYNPNTKNFILHSGMEPDDVNWVEFSTNCYKTKCLRTAAQFKRYADKAAKEVFKNAKPNLYINENIALPSFLDDHQKDGVRWILSRKYSYLSHAPGAGKTAQAIVASEKCLQTGQVVVIVPPTLTTNWEREIVKFVRVFRTVTIIPTTIKKESVDWNAHYIIVPNSMLTKDWVLDGLASVYTKVVIVDEASAFKELTSARSEVLYNRVLCAREIRHVIFLDGSPAPNRAMELYAPLINLSPESIGYMTEYEFGFKYAAAKQGFQGRWQFKGFSNEEVLHRRIHKYLFHTVTEDKLNHPERLRSIVYIDAKNLPPKIKRWEQKNVKQLRLSDLSDDDSKGAIAEWRHEVGLSKIKKSAAYIKEKLDKGKDHILVFAWHRDVCLGLAEELKKYKPFVVIGGTKSKEREKFFEGFNKGKYRLIIGNITALSRGHNLQRADRNIFVEYSWSDEVNKQCEKRASRKGRDASKPVRSDYIVFADSLDEIVLTTAMRREKSIKKVVR